tara:strand:+ start:44 stop:493 length:450 start_codon:yes stop_codon:yes gene_type:complete
VPNLFQKLENKSLVRTGIIIVPEVVDRDYYDKLYENQKDFSHTLWQEFKNAYNLKFKFIENLEQIEQGDNTCIWFFKERPTTKKIKKYKDLEINGHDIEYQPNTILLTNQKINFLENKSVLRRPCVQIDIDSIPIQTRKIIKQMLERIL